MNSDILENEKNLRRFLLGEMADDERTVFENNFIADEELFTELSVAEDSLIEQYLRQELPTTDKEKFEKHYLSNKKLRQKVEFNRQMLAHLTLEKTAEKSVVLTEDVEKRDFFSSLFAFFKQPALAFGLALIVALSFLGYLVFRHSLTSSKLEVAEQKQTKEETKTTQLPTNQSSNKTELNNTLPTETNLDSKNNVPPNTLSPNKNLKTKPLEEKLKERPPTEKAKPQTKPEESRLKPVISTIVLLAGNLRSEGQTAELKLPKNSLGANLNLNLESRDYQTYRAEIVDENGNVIFQSKKVKISKNQVQTFVPGKKLKKGDYLVRLYGKNKQANEESVADYQFRVREEVKKQ